MVFMSHTRAVNSGVMYAHYPGFRAIEDLSISGKSWVPGRSARIRSNKGRSASEKNEDSPDYLCTINQRLETESRRQKN